VTEAADNVVLGSVGVTGKEFCYAAPSNYILSAKASKPNSMHAHHS